MASSTINSLCQLESVCQPPCRHTATQNLRSFPCRRQILSPVRIAPTHGGITRLSSLENTGIVGQPKVVTNPSTNWARRSVTSLMWPIPLPLRETSHLCKWRYIGRHRLRLRLCFLSGFVVVLTLCLRLKTTEFDGIVEAVVGLAVLYYCFISFLKGFNVLILNICTFFLWAFM